MRSTRPASGRSRRSRRPRGCRHRRPHEWVPERRVFSTEYQREIIIPGHYESRITGQQSTVPTLPGYGTRGELPVVIPGGVRPPADQRPGL